jgi:hypothetical protein
MTLRRLFALTAALGLAFAGPALAHHSFAMFDSAKVVTLTGTVKDFQWTNPHVVLWVLTDAEDGKQPEEWTLELTSPGNLTRMGWSRHSLNAGDKVSVELSPLRDGTHGGSLRKATLAATGQVLTSGSLRDLDKPGEE